MGYPTVVYFDYNFVKRTLDNLENSEIKNDFTLLVNSLFGLIIIPNQMNVQERRELSFFDKTIDEFSELDFLKEDTTYSDELSENKYKEIHTPKLYHKYLDYNRILISELLNKMRNGIAHGAIRPTKEDKRWYGIILRCYTRDSHIKRWEDNYDFQVCLSQSELKAISIFIANNYLNEISPKN
jgi:hypothetical protein